MNEMDRRMLIGAAGIAGVAAIAKMAGAGPLDPPPGPVGPTGVTLDEINARIARPSGVAEPRRPLPDPQTGFTIIESGSYYLTRDVEVSEITVNGVEVSIDLCGFTVTTNGFSSNAVVLGQNCLRFTMRNGRIICLSSNGIRGDFAATVLLEDLFLRGFSTAFVSGGVILQQGYAVARRVTVTNFRGAIGLAGVIESCASLDCPGGFNLFGNGGMVKDSVVRNATGIFSGILVNNNASVINCVVNHIGDAPAIRLGSGCVVDGCNVTGGSPGILGFDTCRITRTTVSAAKGAGINVRERTLVSECHIANTVSVPGGDPGVGIKAQQRLRVERSMVTSNASRGIWSTLFDTVVTDCSVVLNGGVGIEIVGPAQIERCHLANNNGAIQFDALTRVAQCHIDFNGPFGIRATDGAVGGTFVTDCDITRHTTGVSIAAGSGNGVFRSRFAGNSTNISAPAGNFQLVAVGAAGANAATNPNVNVVW
jgi:hypothetical protein